MHCSSCGGVHGTDAAFCPHCGVGVPATCPACGAAAAPGDAFCSSCGTQLGAAPAAPPRGLARYMPAELLAKLEAARRGRAMAGERRTVTMLFADIQGSTAAAEQLDPEDWAEVVNGVFERLIRPVHRYEGILANMMGDAVLAFFGAPIAHEDDPERAIRAGLEMLAAARPYARQVEAEWGVAFDLRVGVNTGLVVVGEVGSDLRVDYTALGDAVNVAARMEQTARPGTLQVSAATHRLVAPLFEFERLEPVVAKGKAEPVPAFRVLGARVRPAATRGLPGRDAPMVGRDAELATLRAVVEDVRAGRGALCTVVGEAGVGKSRLVATVRSGLQSEGRLATWGSADEPRDAVQWAEARCLSYDTAVAHAPFIDLFTRLFGLGTHLDGTAARARVKAAVGRVETDDADLVVTDLCALLGLELDPSEAAALAELQPPALQARIFSAVSAYLRACAARRPTVLVFEDLHWSDAVSLSLLEELVAATAAVPVAIVVLARPERDGAAGRLDRLAARAPGGRERSVVLRPLDDDTARELVERLLGGDGLPAPLASTILARADGNPFFVEEIVRDLVESGVLVDEDGRWTLADDADQVTVPAGVSGLLTARLDRLPEAAKLVAQLASVIGREFSLAELEGLVDDRDDARAAVAELIDRELLVAAQDDTDHHAFRHALIREAAYATILRRDRRRLHALVAEQLVSRAAPPQEIARHLLAAGQGQRAVPYLVDAGDRAARAMSLADAIGLYRQAFAHLPDDADVELVGRIHQGLGAVYTLVPDLDRATETYRQLLELGRARSAPRLQVTALNRLGFTAAFLGRDYDGATRHLEQARRLAGEVGDDAGLAEYHRNSCMIATARGDLEQAAAHDAETARIGSAAGATGLEVGGLLQRVISLVLATRYDEAMEGFERAREAVATATDPALQCTLDEAEAFLLLRDGRFAEVRTVAAEAMRRAASLDSSRASVLAFLAGRAAAVLGQFEEALALHGEAMRFGQGVGQLYYAAASAASMVRVHADLGVDDERVATLRARSDELLAGPMGDMLESTVLAELGWAALELGDPARAGELFATGIAGTSATRMFEAPSLLYGLAAVEATTGDVGTAARHVVEADAFVADRGMTQFEALGSWARGTLLQARGDDEAAVDAFGRGVDEAVAVDADRLTWRLQAAAAGALASAGRAREAARALAAARTTIAGLADRIADPPLRDSFVRHATRRLSPAGSPSGG